MQSSDAGLARTGALESLLVQAQPRLVRALIAVRGKSGASDAASEAIVWGWEIGDMLMSLENPIGYLYRVALTKSTPRKTPALPPVDTARLPDVEPGLVPALLGLPERQRVAVWLAHACGWTHAEIAEALDVATSTVSTHVARGLGALRQALGHDASKKSDS